MSNPHTEILPPIDDTAAPPRLPLPISSHEALMATHLAQHAPVDPGTVALHPLVPGPAAQPSVPPPGAPQPGADFHGLKVHSVLGEGGMGAAYLASHKVLRMPLVVKTFKRADPTQIFREAHLAARVSSPNVVSVHDAGVESAMPFVVQRYVDGIDLEELLRTQRAAGRRLPVEMVCRLVLDVACGLRAIHQAGVVHRDVKPANLFLGGNGVASVGDFGVAVESLRHHEHEPVMGTPHFMAPEQWNRSAVDRRTDLYALGATAHLLATNSPPFEGVSALQLGVAHVTEAYRAPTPRDPREAYLFAVIERMMRKRPDERFASADEVVRTLSVVAEDGARIVPQGADSARVGNVHIELDVGNVADQTADVIVNAANPFLIMDLGVANALREAGGDEIEEEAQKQLPESGLVPMGEVRWTSAGQLKARYVAHAVAAIDGAICLQRCALRVLLEAEVRGCERVVFPAMGTGVGEVPMALGAKMMLEAFRTFAWLDPQRTRHLRVVLYQREALEAWRDVLQSM